MPHIALNPEVREHVRTTEVRDESIWQGTVRFDANGVSEQDLDDDVAAAFVESNDAYVYAADIGDAEPVDELAALLEGTVDEVSDAIASGDYDDQLDDLEERAERVGVQEAIDERRAELAADEAGGEDGDDEEGDDADV